jgi:hypothetical protein
VFFIFDLRVYKDRDDAGLDGIGLMGLDWIDGIGLVGWIGLDWIDWIELD